MKKQEKTNVMRLLEQKKVPYVSHCYAETDALAGVEVAPDAVKSVLNYTLADVIA